MPQAGIPRSPGNDVQLDAKCRKICSTGPARQNTFKGSKYVKTHAPSCDDEKGGKTRATSSKSGGNDVQLVQSAGNDMQLVQSAGNNIQLVQSAGNDMQLVLRVKNIEKHAVGTKNSKSCKP